ncbi:hypothetical protein BpHYR1_033986 [Brachionus plicatilis]|uniref:Uncharacterized protein n=1 Tax=Brachionus plicatilis TaxID=10195 RepID=A0A3M7R3V1_BRAPC|nr:hypothetical protein BpHYR1_033986 [Brachionus plicatilis]
MSLCILLDNGEALISFSCTILSNGSDMTKRYLNIRPVLQRRFEDFFTLSGSRTFDLLLARLKHKPAIRAHSGSLKCLLLYLFVAIVVLIVFLRYK